MEEYGDFGRDLVKAIAHRLEPEPGAATYMCGGCSKLMIAWLNPNRNIVCPSCGNGYSYAA
ncbi:hypothetical protein DM02DRAFT_621109 [Periconia macrospinosa]|uniref:Uncharacterized protein n=1 Tax=Periconia macrospinosa TaxID=97972 RepID=A0A2V1CYK0_9PLEO|nr:hypothetical protein DM02DRAFT_621109 [Periconia macrospinosa]